MTGAVRLADVASREAGTLACSIVNAAMQRDVRLLYRGATASSIRLHDATSLAALTRRRALVALVLAVASATPGNRCAGQQVDTVTVEQRVLMTPDLTPADARRRAIDNALAEAVRRVAGVRVQSSALSIVDEQSQTLHGSYVSVVQLDAAGRAVDYRLLRDEWETIKHPELGSQLYYRVELRVVVEAERGAPDPSFGVQVEVTPTLAMVRSERPAQNDELIATIRSTRSARAFVFSVADDSVERLVPNDYAPALSLAEGETVEFPSADWRDRGLRLRASLPRATAEGVAGRRELLMVVAVLDAVAAPPARGSVIELQRWLVRIPASRRAIGFGPYEVRRALR